MADTPVRILHVDDDENMRDIVARAYGDIDDVIILSCSSGDEALSRLREFQPDLMLLDLKMPEKTGPDIMQRLNSDSPAGRNIPVIFVTGYKDVRMQDAYKKMGIIGVIHKPFSPAALVSIINGIWRKHFQPGQA